jgi:BirA family biotin operon repressor/biotin-[acetyl-CoA-carboxylase] ligase
MKAPLDQRVFRALADGQYHSGAQLAEGFGVSRSAIWKAVAALRQLGMVIQAIPNRGYRSAPVGTPLNAAAISAALPQRVGERLRQGGAVWSTTSTNAQLLLRGDLPAGRFDFLAAEYKSAGDIRKFGAERSSARRPLRFPRGRL